MLIKHKFAHRHVVTEEVVVKASTKNWATASYNFVEVKFGKVQSNSSVRVSRATLLTQSMTFSSRRMKRVFSWRSVGEYNWLVHRTGGFRSRERFTFEEWLWHVAPRAMSFLCWDSFRSLEDFVRIQIHTTRNNGLTNLNKMLRRGRAARKEFVYLYFITHACLRQKSIRDIDRNVLIFLKNAG